MRSTSCPRLFEAEAKRDGRLAGAELASFERHASSCPACTREVRELEALAHALRSAPSGTDELHARRERTRLLAAFNRELVSAERRPWPRRWLLVPAGVALVAAALLVFRPTPTAPAVAAGVTVRADSGARWTERTEGDRKQLLVESGALWVHVDRPPGAGRFVVVLPDGELEDIGTTFTVAVVDGRTTRVTVEDGRVVLRLRGQPPVSLRAGERWPTDLPSPSSGSAPPSSASAPPSAPPDPPSSPPSTAPPPARDPSLDFRAAMAAFNAGQAREAAALFASFLAKHPRDPRAEDAAYLRIIAFQRAGDSGAMKEAAHTYLRRYPKGFRRAEAEALTH